MTMTPEEKWKRLTNPQTADDYGLSLTETELETFAEGREVLAGMRQYTTEFDDQCRFAAEFGKAAGEFVEQVRYGVLTATALPPNVEVTGWPALSASPRGSTS